MGIPLRLDVTFLLVPLVLYSVMPPQFQEDALLATVVATLGVFFSILVHELGHAAAARMQQVGVADIVIGGFFGYAHLKRQVIFRRQHLRILLAGPFANLAIFLVIWLILAVVQPSEAGIGVMAHRAGLSPTWIFEALRIVALVNLAMFAFNMLPAYPLDGGKVLGLLLDRWVSPRGSLQTVSLLGISGGVMMVIFGIPLSFLLALIGVLIVVTNVKRLRRSSRPQAAS